MPESNVVNVYSAADAQEANFLKFVLAEAGIESNVVGDTLRNVAGEIPLGWATSPQLWVQNADEGRARAAIEKWKSERAESRIQANDEQWECPQCDELVPGTFDKCWKCQSSRSE